MQVSGYRMQVARYRMHVVTSREFIPALLRVPRIFETLHPIIHLLPSPACPKLGSIDAQARLCDGKSDFEQG